MQVHPAESSDQEQIRAITRDSLQSSYSLSPTQIDTILEAEFDDASLADLLDDADTSVFVVESEIDDAESVCGFTAVEIGTEATIQWLHVDPAARGRGIATALLEHVRDEFAEKPMSARILDDAVEGSSFLEGFGLEESRHDEVTIGEREFDVSVFTEGESTETANEPSVSVPESVTVDGVDRPVEQEDRIPGREAPFFRIYAGGDDEEAYGYFCSECGGTDVAADGLDRLECGNCGNTHRADEWDGAYL